MTTEKHKHFIQQTARTILKCLEKINTGDAISILGSSLCSKICEARLDETNLNKLFDSLKTLVKTEGKEIDLTVVGGGRS